MLAAFLTANLVTALLAVLNSIGWGWLVPGDWLGHLNAAVEGGSADRYHGVLFGAVAVLAAVHAVRAPPPRVGPRWLWALGWVSLAALVGLLAIEELHRRVDAGALIGACFKIQSNLRIHGLTGSPRTVLNL